MVSQIASIKIYLKSYPAFMRELGWRRSVEHFYTSSAIGFIASAFSVISWGEWRERFSTAVTEMISANLFITCLILMLLMLVGHMLCGKHPRIRLFFYRRAFWAGRLCFDLGAAMMGVMIGIAPMIWLIEGVSRLVYLSTALYVLLLLGAIAMIVKGIWSDEQEHSPT